MRSFYSAGVPALHPCAYLPQYSGFVPSELGLLSRLKNLEAHHNDLKGKFPSELGQLTSLVWSIAFLHNHLSGTLPSELGRLSALSISFTFASNLLTGSIPSELGGLTSLAWGFVSHEAHAHASKFHPGAPRSALLFSCALCCACENHALCLCLFLAAQNLGANHLVGSIPSELGRLSNEKDTFDLRYNKLGGRLPTQLGRLSKLQAGLYLSHNSLSGPLPSELGQLSLLTVGLQLIANDFCDDLPPEDARFLSTDKKTEFWLLDGNHFGTPCCVALPYRFTCAPTRTPSPPPTASAPPTHAPTSFPSADPTRPSPPPSPLPTAAPKASGNGGAPLPVQDVVPAMVPGKVGGVDGAVVAWTSIVAMLLGLAMAVVGWRSWAEAKRRAARVESGKVARACSMLLRALGIFFDCLRLMAVLYASRFGLCLSHRPFSPAALVAAREPRREPQPCARRPEPRFHARRRKLHPVREDGPRWWRRWRRWSGFSGGRRRARHAGSRSAVPA